MVGSPQSGLPYEASSNGAARPLFVLQDRYEVVNHLGQGGMGTVYVARDRRLGRRQCVVKKLRDDFFRLEDKEKAMAFFEREVLVLSQLQHSNIVHINDSFKENDDCYLVMEYVEGENLHQMLHRRGEPFPQEQVLQWASQIAEVLDYLHTNDPPVIYRDLKPSNIMIDTKDRVKLVDFGIARPYVEEADNTHVVSAGYSPPEQYWGAADPRSDVYALGATMYFLLTGEEPLALQTSSPRKINPAVSESTDAIVQRATAQDMIMRYQSAVDMKEDLQQVAHSRKGQSAATRTALISLAVLAGVIVLGLGASFFGNLMQQQKQNEAQQERTEKQLDMTKRELRMKADELQRMARTGQAKLTDDYSSHSAPSAASVAKTPRATVAFREVDEAQLTDPDDAPSVNSEPATQKESSYLPPGLKPGALLVPKSPQSSNGSPAQTDEFASGPPPAQ